MWSPSNHAQKDEKEALKLACSPINLFTRFFFLIDLYNMSGPDFVSRDPSFTSNFIFKRSAAFTRQILIFEMF